MSDALHLYPWVVVDDMVKGFQSHLHMLESVFLALLAGVHIRGGHLHQQASGEAFCILHMEGEKSEREIHSTYINSV